MARRDVALVRSSFLHLLCEMCFPGCCENGFKLYLSSHSADLPTVHLPRCMTLQYFSPCLASTSLSVDAYAACVSLRARLVCGCACLVLLHVLSCTTGSHLYPDCLLFRPLLGCVYVQLLTCCMCWSFRLTIFSPACPCAPLETL